MRSVWVISTITFGLIFGGLALTSSHIAETITRPVAADSAASSASHANLIAPDQPTTATEAEVEQTKDELLALRQTLAVQQQTLRLAQQNLAATAAKLDTAQLQYRATNDRSARKLAKVYEAMKPAKAAPILASLELDIVLEIIARMKERQAARILAHMDAGLAARISARLSSQGER